MPGIIIKPDLGKVLVRREGLFTIMREDAGLECNCPAHRGPCGGIDIDALPLQFRVFQLLCREKAQRFIDRQRPRGYEWANGVMALHGPWPSRTQNLTDLNQIKTGRDADGFEHPEDAARFVFESNDETPFVDYLLVGDFLFRDQMTDLELPV